MSGITKLGPQNFQEVLTLADYASETDLVPRDYRGRPKDIVVAIQRGEEVGLSPMQSLDSISVINGRPTIWGDAMLALCQAHPTYVDIEEWIDHKGTDDAVAYCRAKRLNVLGEVTEKLGSFSVDDAKAAYLWGNTKKPPWIQYPMRMLQMRARAWCLRAAFDDVLRGLSQREEVMDYHEGPIKPPPMRHPAIDAVMPKKVEAPKEVEAPKPLSESATSATSPGAVGAEYVMCSAPLETTPEPKAKAKDKAPKVKTKPTNRQRCLDAMERFLEVFGVAGKTLLDTAGIKAKTVDGKLEPVKVTNVQVDWLVDAFTALKDGKKKVTDIFPASDALPPIPPVPSGDIQVDAQQ